MAKETIYVVVRPDGASMRLTEVQMKKMLLDGMKKPTDKSRASAQGLEADFAKIPRRLIVAGGAALAFSLSVGTVLKGLQGWSTAIQTSIDKLKEVNQSTREFVAMFPRGPERVSAEERLIQAARVSPLEKEALGEIWATVRSIRPPSTGATQQERETIRRAAELQQLLRGTSGKEFGAVVAKTRTLYPEVTATQMSNVFGLALTQAGYAGEELGVFFSKLSRGIAPAGVAEMDFPEIMALLIAASRVSGAPGRTPKQVGMMVEKLYKPGVAAKIGIPEGEWGRMGPVERIQAVRRGRGEEAPLSYYQRVYGSRAGAITAAMWETKGLPEQIEAQRRLIRGEMKRKGLEAEVDYAWDMANLPRRRKAWISEMAREVPTLTAEILPGRTRLAAALDVARADIAATTGEGAGGMAWAWMRRTRLNLAAFVGGEAALDPEFMQPAQREAFYAATGAPIRRQEIDPRTQQPLEGPTPKQMQDMGAIRIDEGDERRE